jgi:hypothetical protein
MSDSINPTVLWVLRGIRNTNTEREERDESFVFKTRRMNVGFLVKLYFI